MEVGAWTRVEMKGAEALAGEGVVGRVERGEPMGWRRGRGRSWSGPRAFRTALLGEKEAVQADARSLRRWASPVTASVPIPEIPLPR